MTRQPAEVHCTIQRLKSGVWTYTIAVRGRMWFNVYATRELAYLGARAALVEVFIVRRIGGAA